MDHWSLNIHCCRLGYLAEGSQDWGLLIFTRYYTDRNNVTSVSAGHNCQWTRQINEESNPWPRDSRKQWANDVVHLKNQRVAMRNRRINLVDFMNTFERGGRWSTIMKPWYIVDQTNLTLLCEALRSLAPSLERRDKNQSRVSPNDPILGPDGVSWILSVQRIQWHCTHPLPLKLRILQNLMTKPFQRPTSHVSKSTYFIRVIFVNILINIVFADTEKWR